MVNYEDGRTTRLLHGLMNEIEASSATDNKSLKFLEQYREKYDFVDKFLTKRNKEKQIYVEQQQRIFGVNTE